MTGHQGGYAELHTPSRRPAKSSTVPELVSTVISLYRRPRWLILGSVSSERLVPLTSFVGREATVALVKRRLAEARLVTLVGAGGCGKTRLAIEVGRQTRELLRDEVVFVDLSGLSDPHLVWGAVLGALGLREVPGRDPIDVLEGHLSGREPLVLLDNCEHLVDACADLAASIVRSCPRAWLLATSRQPLGVPGEVLVTVGGLTLPDRALEGEVDWLERSEAGRLFIDRARMSRADFSVGATDAVAIAKICQRLDGMPLALELAAARVRLMSVQGIAEGLSDCFRVLAGDMRTTPPRHKTLFASLEWSFGLISDEERSFLCRLSVFASGFTLAAAEAICAWDGADRECAIRLLSGLVDKSLVQAEPERDRFRLHETTRAFAAAALSAQGGTSDARDDHLFYFTKLSQALGPRFFEPDISAAWAALAPDLDNIRAALDWGIESEQFDLAADLLISLGNFLWLVGLSPEALGRCLQLLAVDAETLAGLSPPRRAGVLQLASKCAWHCDRPAAPGFASELVALALSLGDQGALARGLNELARTQIWIEPHEALKTLDEVLRIASDTGQRHLVVEAVKQKAWAYLWLRRPEEAYQLAEGALGSARQLGWLWGEVNLLTAVTFGAKHSGRLVRAVEAANAMLLVGSDIPGLCVYNSEAHLADAYMHLGDPRAEETLARARSAAEAAGDSGLAAQIATCQGHLLITLGREQEGYDVLEAANARMEALGQTRISVTERAAMAEVALRRSDVDTARRHLEAASGRVPGMDSPEAVPVLRAGVRLARAQGDPQRAHGLACDGLKVAFEAGHVIWAIDLLELVVITSADMGLRAEAARLLGAAEAQREVTGYARGAVQRQELGQVRLDLPERLGEARFEQAVSEGRHLSLEEAVAYARRGRGRRERTVSGWDSLTPAERRVVALVAKRLTNDEIARQLFVSTPTVKSHLNRVFPKLGVRGRAQLAALVASRRAS